MEKLASTVRGDGPEVLLIHGGMNTGQFAWLMQAPLADEWTLRAVDRAGYGASADLSEGEDIELDARLIVGALDEPVHVVGHSSGAIVAILVAAAAPDRVRSVTAIEPPSYRFIDDPDVVRLADVGDEVFDDVESSDADWALRFFAAYGLQAPPSEVVDMLEPHVPAFRRFVVRPYDIDLPVDAVESPSLVVSGGHDPAYERLNDAIADALGARRAVVPGAGHAVQMTGPPFNDELDGFLRSLQQA